MQRFRLRMMRFEYTISHVRGTDLVIADTFSRAQLQKMAQSPTYSKKQKHMYDESTESSHLVSLLLQESSLHSLSFFVKTFLVYNYWLYSTSNCCTAMEQILVKGAGTLR